ncbi:P-loop containing nucleoside triphosphate hydrolase protein [Geopyxis carbonaria]|nr:P-loop containing nucleoside triphosphate hydrolase protein [Geopyxis carbonaria]
MGSLRRSTSNSSRRSLDSTSESGSESGLLATTDDQYPEKKWSCLFAFVGRHHWIVLATTIVLSILSGLILPAMSILMGRIFGAFSKLGSGQLTATKFVDEVKIHVMGLMILGFVSWILRSSFFAAWLFFGELQSRAVKAVLFRKLIDKDLEWYENQRNGLSALLSKCQTQTKELQTALSQPMGYVTESIATIVASLCIAFYHSWDLTFVIFAGVPITFWVMSILSARIQPQIDIQKKHLSEAGQTVSRAISCIDTVKYFNGQKHEENEFKKAVRQAAEAYRSQAKIGAMQTGFIRFNTLVIFVQGFWYGGYLIRNGDESQAKSVMTTFWSCLMAIQALELVFPQISHLEKGRAAGAELGDLIHRVNKDRGGVFQRHGGRTPESCAGSIQIQDVSFAYPSRPGDLALQGVSLSIPPQETTFIIGRSGSGKTTLGSLIQNSYTPISGEILIDGCSSKSLDPRWIRQHISLVQQHSVLFDESIFHNIAFGRLDYEHVSRACVSNACKMVALELMDLDTKVGVGGRLLSGGQLQRVALAREKLRNATILIMDESLSALDVSNRTKVLKSIREWRKGKTTVIITHDISEIESGDLVYVLDRGKIVQKGRRNDIERTKGPFKSFVAASDLETKNYTVQKEILIEGLDTTCTRSVDNQDVDECDAILENSKEPLLASPKIMDDIGFENPSNHSLSSIKMKAIPTTLPRIFSTIWPTLSRQSRIMLITGFVFAAIHAAATPLFSFALSRLINTVLNSRSLASETKFWSTIIIIIAFGDTASCYVFHTLLEFCGQAWADQLRVEAFSKMLAQPRSWFDDQDNQPSRILEDLEKNVEEMRELLSKFAGYIFTSLMMLSIGVCWSLVLSWKLTLVGLAIGPIMYGITRGLSWTSDQWEKCCNDSSETIGVILHETITNIWTVRNFSLERYFRNKYFEMLRQSFGLGVKRSLLEGIGSGLADSVIIFATAAVFAYGSILVGKDKKTLQDILSVITLLLFSLVSAEASISMIPQLSSSKDATRRVLRLVDLDKTSHETIGNEIITNCGDITFENVSFSYPIRSDISVLRGLDLKVFAGSCVALVGNSGSGKSTIASLLLRLYPVKAGAIKFAGRPLTEISTFNIRSEVAIVSQTPVLFEFSIADNITYGLPENSVTAARIEAAARAVGLHEFITELPNGYNTLLGDKGSGLSGGQTQRIAIARALVRKPRVLILDECTSNLDAESARTVREAIVDLVDTEANGRGCTVLLITHNVQLMRAAQKIVVLKEGRIAEQGNWDELMKNRGELERLVSGGILEE